MQLYQYSPKAREKASGGLGFDEVFVKAGAGPVPGQTAQQISAAGRRTHPQDKYEDKLDNHLKIRDSNLKGPKNASTPRTPFHQSVQDQFTSKSGRQSSPAIGAIATKVAPPNGAGQNINENPVSLGANKNLNQAAIMSNIEKPEGGSAKDQTALKNIEALQSEAANSTGSVNNICEDSFQKLYSKELDIDEDEVPLILHELNDSAIHFISKEQYDRALSLLQKAQTLLDRLMFQRNAMDRFLIQCTMHNMALCFQKMGALEECSLCLDACLSQISSPYVERLYRSDPPRKLKRLKYECKIHMQVCALLSQLNRHQEALCHAKRSVQISQYMVNDLMELCETVNQRIAQAKKREQVAQDILQKGEMNPQLSQFLSGFDGDNYLKEYTENKLNKSDLIYFDEQVSMLERTALKYYPIIQEVAKRMTRHKENQPTQPLQLSKSNSQRSKPFDGDLKSFREKREQQKKEEEERQVNPYQSDWVIQKQKELKAKANDKSLANSINMRVLLGYLNQSEWMYLLNIGNIMQITPLTIHDLHSTASIEVELARDSIIEKISFLAVSYFCVSTELRFLVNMRDNPNVDPVQVKAESEYWHGKALEISCSFLPSESPLVSHIHQSYKKHHAPVGQVISEEDETDNGKKKSQKRTDLDLKVIRPLQGIDQAKYQPMVRANHNMNIALSPLNMSPNNYIKKQFEKFAQSNLGQQQEKSGSTRTEQAKGHNDGQIGSHQARSNGGNAPAAIKIHDEQSSKIDKNIDIGPLQNSQKIQAELQKEKNRPGRFDDDNLKVVDPLNTVTTLNFKEIRNAIEKLSPTNQGLRQPESQKAEERSSKNEQQQYQAAPASGTSAVPNSLLQKQRTNNESNDTRPPQGRQRPENEAAKLDQLGDLSEIVKEERTVNDTMDHQRMHDSADNINNTTEMIMELADRNFESLNSQESMKNNRNPPPSAQQNSSGITIPNNEQQDPKYIGKTSQFKKQARSPTNMAPLIQQDVGNGHFNTMDNDSSSTRGARQRPERPDDRRPSKPDSQSDRNGRTHQSRYLKDTKIDHELLARDNDGKAQPRRGAHNTHLNTIDSAQNNQLVIANGQQKSRPKTSENQLQNVPQNRDQPPHPRNNLAGLTAQSSTLLSDGKMNQNKSYQTLNAMPSSQSNVESNTDKMLLNVGKIGGNVTLSTSMNMPSQQSNGDLAQHRSSTQQHCYRSGNHSPQRNHERSHAENQEPGTHAQAAGQVLAQKNNWKNDLISPPNEREQKNQQQLRDAVIELQAKRHDLNVSSGGKESNMVTGFSNIASAKNQSSLQKKLQSQLFEQSTKQKQGQPSGKPLSGTRLSKSSKKQKYSHRGPPPPDQAKSREFLLQNQASAQQMMMQQSVQQKIYASQGSLVAQADQLQSQKLYKQQAGKSVGRVEAASRYKQNQNQAQNVSKGPNPAHAQAKGALFIQTDQAQQQDVLSLEGPVAYRQIQTAIGSTRNSKTPHDKGIGSSNFQTTPVSSQNLAGEQRLKAHQTLEQVGSTHNGGSFQAQQSAQSRNVLKINNSLISKSQGPTRQSSQKRYKIQSTREPGHQEAQSLERPGQQEQQHNAKRKGPITTDMSTDHVQHAFSTHQVNQDHAQAQNLSMNSGGRMNISAEHLNQNNVSYQTSSAAVNRTNLEIIQSKHQQMYTRSSNSREKDRKPTQKSSANVNTTQAQQLKILKSGQQQAFASAKVPGQLVNKIFHQQANNQMLVPAGAIKNQNFVQAMGQSSHRGETSQASTQMAGGAASSAIQQNRNFEIQTQMLGQQMKLKAARTSVQTPTGPMTAIPSAGQQPKVSKMQQLQAQTANRSASGGSSGARSGVAMSSGSRPRPNAAQISNPMIQMNIHPVVAQQQQIKIAQQKSQRNSAKKYQDNGKQVLIHSSRNDRGLAIPQDVQVQQFQTDGVLRANGGNSERGSNKQLMIQVQQRPGSASHQKHRVEASGGPQEGLSLEKKMQKQKNASRNQYNQNLTAVGPPNPTGASKTMPEHHEGSQLFAKQSKTSRNAPNQLQQPSLSMQSINAIAMNQGTLMNEDISHVKDLQLQIQSKLTDMQRGLQSNPAMFSAQQRQSAKPTTDGSSGRMSAQQSGQPQVKQASKSAGKLTAQNQLELQMNMLNQQQREHIKAVNAQQQVDQQIILRQQQVRPQSSNRNKLQLNMKMQSGATDRTSTSGNERVANENERSNHGNLMILHGGGGMMSGHHIKSAGGLNTAKNNDHKIKFSAVSLAPSGGNLDSQRSGIHFNQQNVKNDMKNNSQNLHNLQNFNNFNGASLEISMNNRFPGTALNTSTAFPSTPNLQSARGSVNNIAQDHGNTINSSNSSSMNIQNLISHKGGTLTGAAGHSQSYQQLSIGSQLQHQQLNQNSSQHTGANTSNSMSSLPQNQGLMHHSSIQVTNSGQQHGQSHPHNAKAGMKISVNQNNRKSKQQQQAQLQTVKQSVEQKVNITSASFRTEGGAAGEHKVRSNPQLQQQQHQPSIGGRPQRVVNVRKE